LKKRGKGSINFLTHGLGQELIKQQFQTTLCVKSNDEVFYS